MKYLTETYDQLVSCENYGFSQELYDTLPEWKVLKSLYQRNYVDPSVAIEIHGASNSIPKIIHQIWLGGELPEEYKRFTESWQKFHPDWDYCLWGDEDAAIFPMQNREAFHDAPTKGQKSDIWRYEILKKYGGLYVDTDFECLKPFDDLMYLDFFTSSGYTSNVELYIGLIACVPDHPIINRVVRNMTGVHKNNSVVDVFNTTGSYYFTKCFLEEVNENTDWVCAFPSKFFYPFPNNDRESKTPYKYVKEYSYSIHHWCISWLLRKKS